jgi:hypothetical protein
MAVERSTPRLPAQVLALSVLSGALAAAAFQALEARLADDGADVQPPLIILDVAAAIAAGKDAAAIRATADRLADAGLLVLDAQAVLAAPTALYVPQAGAGTR